MRDLRQHVVRTARSKRPAGRAGDIGAERARAPAAAAAADEWNDAIGISAPGKVAVVAERERIEIAQRRGRRATRCAGDEHPLKLIERLARGRGSNDLRQVRLDL